MSLGADAAADELRRAIVALDAFADVDAERRWRALLLSSDVAAAARALAQLTKARKRPPAVSCVCVCACCVADSAAVR